MNLSIPTAAFHTMTTPDTEEKTPSAAAELRGRGCEASTTATGLRDCGKENEEDNANKH